jgi:hypothetical protein
MESRAERPERETEMGGLVEREKECWLKLEVAWVLKMAIAKLKTRVFL